MSEQPWVDLDDWSPDEGWGESAAAGYDDPDDPMASAAVLGPTVDFLAELAGRGAALELAIGTGRVAVPLAARGVPVSGIELSGPMAARVRDKVGEGIPVVLGDMTSATAPGRFSLVYLVYNTITNLLTQDAQVACFVNAAAHLEPGGRFVVECFIPALRRLPIGQLAVPFSVTPRHLGVDTYDPARQRLVSHHYLTQADGSVRVSRGPFRYAWPAEMDLMARIAGMSLEARYADWDRSTFTGDSSSAVSVWRKAA